MTVIVSYSNSKPILYGAQLLDAVVAVNVTSESLLPSFNGRKQLDAGMFCAATARGGVLLPRTRLAEPVASNANTIKLKKPNSQILPSTLLWVLGYATLTFPTATSGTNFHFFFNRQLITVPGQADGGATAAYVVAQAEALGLTALGFTPRRVGSTAEVELFATDSWSLEAPLTVTVKTTIPGYFGYYPVPLGTTSAVSTVDSNDIRTYTLTGTNGTGVVLPANTIVTEKVFEFLGIHISEIDVTSDAPPSGTEFSIAPIRLASGVYENNLPYMDEEIRRDKYLAQLAINKFFYGDRNDFVSNYPNI
jgi:hypothetical protein